MSDPPSTSPTPPEGSIAAPSPLTVGKRFVKQYYQVLSSTPDQVFKFYQPKASFLSHAEGSDPTDHCIFESYDITKRWGDDSEANTKKRFELEHGAIDAQPSVNGSILLVVTGHVVFATKGKEERKAFVHTFFLALMGKRYYVHNDVLRFLTKDPAAVVASDASKTATDAHASTLEPGEQPKEEKPVEQTSTEPAEEEPVKPRDDAPGSGVEETKEEAPEEEKEQELVDEPERKEAAEEATPEAAEAAKEEPALKEAKKETEKEATGKGGKPKGRGRSPPQQQQQQQKQQPASKPASSWASLVASGPPAPSQVAPSPAKASAKAPAPAKAPAKEESAPEKPKPAPQQEKESKDKRNRGDDRPKRDPDCTLVIKNLADSSKESDLVNLFEKFASKTNSKIVGTTVAAHRNLAFVDYDSVAAVMAAVEQHGKEPIQLNGRVLEVDQKTAEQRARKVRGGGGGGGYRSGSPGNGGKFQGGSGGGRRDRQRDRDRQGNRGGGGSSRGARGGGGGGNK